jgi:hypothetical protein
MKTMRDKARDAPGPARGGRFDARWEAAYLVVRARMACRSQTGPAAARPLEAVEACDGARSELDAGRTLEHNSRFAIDPDS